MGYKSLLSEVHGNKVVTPETIKACQENEQLNKMKKVDAKIQAAADKLDITYDEWMTEARKFYSVVNNHGSWSVESVARSANTPSEVWHVSGEVEAKEKILQLITYKQYDHFVRGCDFAYKIK